MPHTGTFSQLEAAPRLEYKTLDPGPVLISQYHIVRCFSSLLLKGTMIAF